MENKDPVILFRQVIAVRAYHFEFVICDPKSSAPMPVGYCIVNTRSERCDCYVDPRWGYTQKYLTELARKVYGMAKEIEENIFS